MLTPPELLLAVKDRTRELKSLGSSSGFFSTPPACAKSIPRVRGVVTAPLSRTGVGLTMSPLEECWWLLFFAPFCGGESLAADFCWDEEFRCVLFKVVQVIRFVCIPSNGLT